MVIVVQGVTRGHMQGRVVANGPELNEALKWRGTKQESLGFGPEMIPKVHVHFLTIANPQKLFSFFLFCLSFNSNHLVKLPL